MEFARDVARPPGGINGGVDCQRGQQRDLRGLKQQRRGGVVQTFPSYVLLLVLAKKMRLEKLVGVCLVSDLVGEVCGGS